ACACATGYEGDGTTGGTGCTDIDECVVVAEACGLAACDNTVGSFTCTVMYGASPFQDVGWVVNPDTLEDIGSYANSLAGGTITGVTAMATDPTTGTHYAVAKVSGVTGRVLVTVDFQPGAIVLTEVGNLGTNYATLAFREDGQ